MNIQEFSNATDGDNSRVCLGRPSQYKAWYINQSKYV